MPADAQITLNSDCLVSSKAARFFGSCFKIRSKTNAFKRTASELLQVGHVSGIGEVEVLAELRYKRLFELGVVDEQVDDFVSQTPGKVV